MSTTLTIAKREFRSYFDSPLAYVVVCLCLVVLGVFFFLVGGTFLGGTFWDVGRASLTRMFEIVPILLAFIVPVVTMRLLAEEKRSGTLEMLITLPVKDHEVILGKFIGAYSLMLVLLAATALYPVLMFFKPWHLGALDSGPVISGYIGLALYAAAVTAIGLLLSALTESQFLALLMTWFVLFFLQFIGGLADLASEWFGTTVRNGLYLLSFGKRLEPFARGKIAIQDVVYFVSITIGCLMAAFRALERRKWA
ncbi:ABC transporter permease [Chondromyces apiculatus]|uniref:Gliding motility protein GldF n=1 Tax=Chondromyces apiculatus DSM 436 TaxID=1192034 RepID=A0A017T428_9BACT|nr:ABC transporter permease [Chondromyces apiculatus]EYF03535.1 gliding motility protein GldF [Chondromyces apiculatus DSM 436]